MVKSYYTKKQIKKLNELDELLKENTTFFKLQHKVDLINIELDELRDINKKLVEENKKLNEQITTMIKDNINKNIQNKSVTEIYTEWLYGSQESRN